jgi:hypothetical protein
MTKIVAFFEIFILLTCAVYLVFRVIKAITQKIPQEPKKETLCDTCEHLVHKGGDIELGKYKCEFELVSFYKSPEYCRNYEQREENKELPEAKP